MADRPILFSAPMVRALLDGRKTQTRRILKPQPYPLEGRPGFWNASGAVGGRICVSDRALLDLHHKPKPGDRLWVRESFLPDPPSDDPSWHDHTCTYVEWSGCGSHISDVPPPLREPAFCIYASDLEWFAANSIDWRPSIHMPRWASRITLTVTEVRVERLQDISEADAIAEGIGRSPHGKGDQWLDYPAGFSASGWTDPRDSYRTLWDNINGPGAWDKNPWVAAYTFSVTPRNIDRIAPC